MQSNQSGKTNISQQDVDQWLKSATPDQVISMTQCGLNEIAGYPQEQRNQFSNGLDNKVHERLFERSPATT